MAENNGCFYRWCHTWTFTFYTGCAETEPGSLPPWRLERWLGASWYLSHAFVVLYTKSVRERPLRGVWLHWLLETLRSLLIHVSTRSTQTADVISLGCRRTTGCHTVSHWGTRASPAPEAGSGRVLPPDAPWAVLAPLHGPFRAHWERESSPCGSFQSAPGWAGCPGPPPDWRRVRRPSGSGKKCRGPMAHFM